MKGLKVFVDLPFSRLAAIAFLVTVGYFFLYYDDGTTIKDQITANEGIRADAERRRNDTHKTMKREEEMRGNVEQVALNLKAVSSKIPIEFTPVEISSVVNRVAVSSQVKIIKLNGAPTGEAIRKTYTGMVGAELIEEIVFNVELQGTFNALVTFVEGLSREEKTIKVRNFSLEKVDPRSMTDGQLSFKGEIVGFKQAPVKNPEAKQ